MDQRQMASIRSFLVNKMAALRASADHTVRQLRISDAVCPDPIDHAIIETCKDIELNCRNKDWHLLLDIQETILRIDRGLFGTCDHCGRRISPKRLNALPMSKLCLTCQQEVELQHNKSRRKGSAERISHHHA